VTQNVQRFKNKIVIVTGAANGIGRAIALRFGGEGAYVVVNDVDATGAEATVQAISAEGGSAIAGVADVSDKSQVDRLFDTTLESFGAVDVLVNNAGLTNTERHFLEADASWWDRILQVNLRGTFLCAAGSDLHIVCSDCSFWKGLGYVSGYNMLELRGACQIIMVQ